MKLNNSTYPLMLTMLEPLKYNILMLMKRGKHENGSITKIVDKLYAILHGKVGELSVFKSAFILLPVIGLLHAIFGLANIGIAVLVHEGSVLVVIFNALRLLACKK